MNVRKERFSYARPFGNFDLNRQVAQGELYTTEGALATVFTIVYDKTDDFFSSYTIEHFQRFSSPRQLE